MFPFLSGLSSLGRYGQGAKKKPPSKKKTYEREDLEYQQTAQIFVPL